MKILAIETSCDETSVSIVQSIDKEKLEILSNVISSSLPLHAETGGIIPEIAAREQLKLIIPVLDLALKKANIKNPEEEIDKIAVTVGPGLIGSLLVGVETAKTLAFVWKKPIIGVNHVFGHIYANFISEKSKIKNQKSKIIEFPVIVLVVSGGHTDLLLMNSHAEFKWLGGTRDDAAGEAFDKIGRLLALPYPGGPEIEKQAKNGDEKAFNFPRPMINSNDLDFSFSGLKTAVLRETLKKKLNKKMVADISASAQKAIIDILIRKTLKAAREYKVKSVLLSGGVVANQRLRDEFKSSIINLQSSIRLFVPPKNLCTDNAAMIAAAGFFTGKDADFEKIDAQPDLYFD